MLLYQFLSVLSSLLGVCSCQSCTGQLSRPALEGAFPNHLARPFHPSAFLQAPAVLQPVLCVCACSGQAFPWGGAKGPAQAWTSSSPAVLSTQVTS